MAQAVNRDAMPDIDERARRMPELVVAEAQPVADLCLELDLPLSTFDKLRAEGKGPRCFKLGRRLYVHRTHKAEWLRKVADAEAA